MKRKQIAAANWKMNLTLSEGKKLLDTLIGQSLLLNDNQEVIIGVPFPYLIAFKPELDNCSGFFIGAQNVAATPNGAFTGEVSATMLNDLKVKYVIIGHSERRLYFSETSAILSEKVNRALENELIPIFCCGESLEIREAGTQNQFVENQIIDGLFHLSPMQISKLIIAYEPIWAIGTGKTATSDQVQAMHEVIRNIIASQYGTDIAQEISILYGGSVKASNAKEIFNKPDVDGGLVGGASLIALEFSEIIKALKR